MKLNFGTFLRIFLAAIGVLLCAVAVFAAIFDRFHEGNAGLAVIGAGCIAVGAFNLKRYKMLKWLVPAFCGILCLLTVLCLLLFLCPSNCLTFNEDVIIVPGVQIDRYDLPAELKARLDAAVEYHGKNPLALMVLSGGGSSGANQSLAMKDYLVQKGVNPDRIVLEGNSRNTYENLLLSKQIIRSQLGENCQIGFITGNYHVFRTKSMANSMGITPTYGVSKTPLISVLPNCVRECMAIARFWLLGY